MFFPVLAWVLSGFLPQSEDMHISLTGDPNLSVGVNITVDGRLSLSVLAL